MTMTKKKNRIIVALILLTIILCSLPIVNVTAAKTGSGVLKYVPVQGPVYDKTKTYFRELEDALTNSSDVKFEYTHNGYWTLDNSNIVATRDSGVSIDNYDNTDGIGVEGARYTVPAYGTITKYPNITYKATSAKNAITGNPVDLYLTITKVTMHNITGSAQVVPFVERVVNNGSNTRLLFTSFISPKSSPVQVCGVSLDFKFTVYENGQKVNNALIPAVFKDIDTLDNASWREAGQVQANKYQYFGNLPYVESIDFKNANTEDFYVIEGTYLSRTGNRFYSMAPIVSESVNGGVVAQSREITGTHTTYSYYDTMKKDEFTGVSTVVKSDEIMTWTGSHCATRVQGVADVKVRKGHAYIVKTSDISGTNDLVNGAVFTLYEENGTTLAKDLFGNTVTLTVNSNSTSQFIVLPGTYVLKETSVPNNFKKADDKTITVTTSHTESNPLVVSIVNHLQYSNLSIKKTIDRQDVASSYSLKDITFGVYTDSNCTVLAKDVISEEDAILTVKSNGNTNNVRLFFGTYYVKEISNKDYFETNNTVYTVVLNTDGEQKVIDVENTLKPGKGKINKSWQ